MDEQKSLFDVPTGERLRDEAIALVESNAIVFCVRVLETIRDMRKARVHDAITTDDVWEALNTLGISRPPEPRAMGGAMRQAASHGLIEPTDRFDLSKRPACHRRPVKVWRYL